MKNIYFISLFTLICTPLHPIVSHSLKPKIRYQDAAWGTSVQIDLNHCSPSKIRSQYQLSSFIHAVWIHLGVTPYETPTILYHYSGYGFTSGMSVTQQANGHTDITLRVNEATNSMYIDLFSCVAYDPHEIAQIAQSFFRAFAHTVHVVQRR